MNAQAKPSEPSMEEILASIRRIISDDEVKPAEAAPEPEAAPVAPPEPVAAIALEIDDDVLDLGAEANLVPAPEPEPVAASAPPVLEDIDFLDATEQPAPPPAAPVAVAPPELMQAFTPPPFQPAAAAPQFDMASLISDQTSTAVHSAFGALAHTVLSNNARTLEDLVKDMLKPMLKSWLDDNLPTMVERLVRAEIERVARGGRS